MGTISKTSEAIDALVAQIIEEIGPELLAMVLKVDGAPDEIVKATIENREETVKELQEKAKEVEPDGH